MAVAKKCQGKHKGAIVKQYKCTRDATHDDGTHCIFHAKEKDAVEFKTALKAIVQQWIEEKADEWNFSGFVFPSDIGAKGITPSRYSERKALFPVKVNFRSATFNGTVSFNSSVFSEEAFFNEAIFKKKVSFSKADFRGSAEFSNAAFYDETDFWKTAFSTHGKFEDIEIHGYVKWIWPGTGKRGDKVDRGVLRFENLIFEENAVLDLRSNALQDDCKLEIYKCKMNYILLEGTDCTQIKFYDNIWPTVKDRIESLLGFGVGRGAVGDECYARTKAEDKSDWPLIRRTYQQLARRFREDLDHPKANEFDRGSFEMRRLEALQDIKDYKHLLRGFSTYVGMCFYKNVSHYSGSLGLPLLWLAGSIVAFGWLYFSFTGGYKQELTLLPWNVDWELMGKYFKDTLKVIAFGKPDMPELKNSGFWLHSLMMFQRVFSATIVTLFVFAIRRRFKH